MAIENVNIGWKYRLKIVGAELLHKTLGIAICSVYICSPNHNVHSNAVLSKAFR
jgi:hypothetical protein